MNQDRFFGGFLASWILNKFLSKNQLAKPPPQKSVQLLNKNIF